MQLKIYQQNAIDELLDKAKRLLGYSGSLALFGQHRDIFIFKAERS